MSSTPLKLIKEIYNGMQASIVNEQYDQLPKLAAEYRACAVEVIQTIGAEPLGSPGISLWHLVQSISDLDGSALSRHLSNGGAHIVSTLPVTDDVLREGLDLEELDKNLLVERYIVSNKSFELDSSFLRTLNKLVGKDVNCAAKLADHILNSSNSLFVNEHKRHLSVAFLFFISNIPFRIASLKRHEEALKRSLVDSDANIYLDTIVALKRNGCDKLAKDLFMPETLPVSVGNGDSSDEALYIDEIVRSIGLSQEFKRDVKDFMDVSGLFFVIYDHIVRPNDTCEHFLESSALLHLYDFPYLVGSAIKNARTAGREVDDDAVVGLLNLYCNFSNFDQKEASLSWQVDGRYLAQVKELKEMGGDYLERELGL